MAADAAAPVGAVEIVAGDPQPGAGDQHVVVGKLTLTVRPGAYRLLSWQRICDANCGHLDPPSSQCARPVTVREGEQLHAVIEVDFVSRCQIVLRR